MLLASPPCQSWSVAGKRQGRPTAFLDALAGRYDAEYRAQLRLAIAGQQQAREDWTAAWRAEADRRGWWADDGRVGPGLSLPGMPPHAVARSAAASPDGLSAHGAAERLRLLGPAPQVEDERGMYMAETVRWVTELDHPTKIALERRASVVLLPDGSCTGASLASPQVSSTEGCARRVIFTHCLA